MAYTPFDKNHLFEFKIITQPVQSLSTLFVQYSQPASHHLREKPENGTMALVPDPQSLLHFRNTYYHDTGIQIDSPPLSNELHSQDACVLLILP
jgi:hypothetical protein